MPEPPTSFATHSATSAPRNDQGDQHARLNAARMVFQACSCAFELREELPQLRELLHTTRRSLGTRGFQQLLSQAAESLMNEDA